MMKKSVQEEQKITGEHELPEGIPRTMPDEGVFLSESEWNALDDASLEQTPATESFLLGITEEQTKKRGIINYLNGWRVAAAVLVFVGLGAVFFYKADKQQTTAPLVSGNNTKAAEASSIHAITIRNSQARTASYQLSDGSTVLLSPHSEITYLPLFEANKRDIKLEGEAVFEVAKDASRPFTVYCKEVETRALGTKFRVSMLRDSGHVSVVLLEGKILVNSIDVAYQGRKYYLLPGNEIEYNRKSSRFTLNAMQDISPAAIAIATPADKEVNPLVETGIQVNAEKKVTKFNDVGMAKVLNVLARKYGVSIAYPTDRINDIRFVGTLRDSDPVEKILKDITSMNSLSLSFDSAHNKYTIH